MLTGLVSSQSLLSYSLPSFSFVFSWFFLSSFFYKDNLIRLGSLWWSHLTLIIHKDPVPKMSHSEVLGLNSSKYDFRGIQFIIWLYCYFCILILCLTTLLTPLQMLIYMRILLRIIYLHNKLILYFSLPYHSYIFCLPTVIKVCDSVLH